jgi:hypothetical protein
MKLNDREKRILSMIIASWGIFLVGSGLIMNGNVKTIVNTKYSLNVEEKKIAQTQAKSNEIKLKEITSEINNTISVDVKDYLEDVDNLTQDTIKSLKLDTSLVNINQAGKYQYTITYGKKKYIGTVTIKEKELPNVTFTLKNLTLTTGDAISTNPRTFINETISDDVYNNLTLDISQVVNTVQGNYKYYIIYNNTTYEGNIYIQDPGPKIITSNSKDDTTNTNTNTTTTTEEETNQ